MKLRTKFVLVLVAVLVVLTAGNLGALAVYQDEIVAQERANVDETANLTADQIEKTIEVRKSEVARYGQKYPHDDLTWAGDYVQDFLDINQHYFVATVIDEDGNVTAAVGAWQQEQREAELEENYADEPFFEAGMTGRVSVQQQGTDIVAVTAPLYGSENEEVVGIVRTAVRVDAVSFFPMLRPLETDRQTVRVAGTDGRPLRAPQQQFNTSINGTAQVEGLAWTVTVSRDRSTLDERQQYLGALQGLSLLLVFAAVLGFGVWEYRSNLRQTGRLLDAFERIKGGNYGHRLSLASAEEWRQISDGFNDLARGLALREAQLLEREQRLGVLNRVLRHNVRNDMSVILNYAQLIRETTADEQAATAADTIVDTGRKLTDLSEKARQIEEALESAESGLVEQDLVALVEGVLATARSNHGGVDVVFEGRGDLAAAAIPSLQVAIENVVENAIEHNDSEAPRVEVAVGEIVRDGEERVVLKVADNGPGIPEQEKNVLVQGRETALEHGSGLGLWLVYWVVDKSEGNLAFDENEPRGSVVTIELHASVPEDPTPTEPIDADAEPVVGEPELPDGVAEQRPTD
jgi:signal transduction histidine kinase/Tfp pilus assembly protein PilV